ncbi:MAG: hypothetical protein Q4D99_04355 [Bacillota bacterium]|nr:hypothetical protein [Bacillota bacterium]
MSITKKLNKATTEHLRNSLKARASFIKLLYLLTGNIDESIRFIKEECNADQYGFLASLLPELIKRTNDVRFINCFEELEEKYTNEFYCYFVDKRIEEAKEYLK